MGTFSWAANVIWEAKRGRSWYRQWPFNVAVALVALVLVTMVLMGLVLTGPIAKSVGEQLGIGSTGLAIWGIAKWPTIVGAVALMITGLYYVAPDVRRPSWPWLTPGAMLAVIVWALTSVGFGLYIANFGTRPIEVSSPPEMRRQSPSERSRLIDVRCGAHLPTIPSWRARVKPTSRTGPLGSDSRPQGAHHRLFVRAGGRTSDGSPPRWSTDTLPPRSL